MLNTPIDFKARRLESRRTQILMAAAQVFSQKGFHRSTTWEIAQAAKVSEGTIYNYFNNKHDLLVTTVELLSLEVLKGITPDHPAENPKDFLTAFLKNLYQLLQVRSHLARPVLAEILVDTELQARLYQELVRPVVACFEENMQQSTCLSQRQQNDLIILTYALAGALLLNFALQSTNLDPRYKSISAGDIIEQLVSLFLARSVSEEGAG